jgi:hypothetical protein
VKTAQPAIAAVLTMLLCAAGIAVADSSNLLGVTVVDSYVSPKGAYVNIVTPGRPGAAAGLRPSDIIVGADGHPVTGAGALNAILARHRAGDEITLRVVHYGKAPTDISVALGGAGKVPSARPAAAASRPARVAAAAPPMRAGAAAAPSTRWVTYTDPAEHAFSIQVPAGWSVAGGSRRMSAVEIRSGVETRSPDGSMILFYGDLNVPVFTVPSQMLAMAGFRPGMVYSPGYGQQFLVMPYLSGENFAAQWGGRRVGNYCSGVSLLRAQPRPDASRGIDMAYAQMGIRTSVQAGEASFSCTMAGGPADAYVFAGTELVQASAGSMWDLKSFAGFVATAARAGAANMLLSHMVTSFAIDPNWAARQAQLTAQTTQIVTQTNQVVSNAIIQNGRTLSETSDRIFEAGQARSRAEDNAIENYDEKAVRGTSEYVNPETGATYGNLDNTKAHQYVNPSGQTFGTDSENSPGLGWTELQRVPPGQ